MTFRPLKPDADTMIQPAAGTDHSPLLEELRAMMLGAPDEQMPMAPPVPAPAPVPRDIEPLSGLTLRLSAAEIWSAQVVEAALAALSAAGRPAMAAELSRRLQRQPVLNAGQVLAEVAVFLRVEEMPEQGSVLGGQIRLAAQQRDRLRALLAGRLSAPTPREARWLRDLHLLVPGADAGLPLSLGIEAGQWYWLASAPGGPPVTCVVPNGTLSEELRPTMEAIYAHRDGIARELHLDVEKMTVRCETDASLLRILLPPR